jgi:TonB family protein
MRATVCTAAFITTLWTGACYGQTPHVVVNPDWEHRPTAEEAAKVWPAAATQKGIREGKATLKCTVAATGLLEGCRVEGEDPPGAGFGEAALSLSTVMRMKPRTVDGQPVGGAAVTVPVQFSNPAPILKEPKFDTPPDWLRKPTLDQMMAALVPAKAAAAGQSGKARIKCWVRTNGLLRDCEILDETPKGFGFGGAALSLAPFFLMKPALNRGQPVESEVTIPVNFPDVERPGPGQFATTIRVLRAPVWSAAPAPEAVNAAIAAKVRQTDSAGQVALQCDVNRKTGKLSSCTVMNASIGSAGFEGAARMLVSRFQVSPSAIPDGNAEVRVNVSFDFPNMSREGWEKRSLTHPQWTRTVVIPPHAKLFPDQAAKAGLTTGSATVQCTVAANGTLSDCAAIKESTPNMGFGEIATDIAKLYAVNPWDNSGLPSQGAQVFMPITLKLAADPQAEPSKPQAAAASPPAKP